MVCWSTTGGQLKDDPGQPKQFCLSRVNEMLEEFYGRCRQLGVNKIMDKVRQQYYQIQAKVTL
jgi:hypothetical protein